MESTKYKLKEWYNKKFCLDKFMDKTVREIFRDYNDLNEEEFWGMVYGEDDGGYDYCCTESMYKYYMYLQNGGEPIETVTESKKPAKKALKEYLDGCFYIIHESPIGYKGRQGWVDDYSELTSDIGSAEQYDTLQEAVDMLYAIEEYVENFNDNEGIRVTIQMVDPDARPVVEDMAVVDIQKLRGVVDCEPVSGEQNLINCGYGVEDSEPSMGYNL